jgi:hypothetical protein
MKFVIDSADDLAAKCRSVPTLGNKTITVISIDDLIAQMTSAVKPAVGILYEGARSVNTDGSKQLGVTGEIVFSLLLLSETSTLSIIPNFISPAHDLLDTIRGAIHGTRAPSGHYWKWVMEAPAAQKGSLQVWVQRWTCNVQLPPKQ